jgi:DNA-binding CsgD family transcriptional regulator
MRGVGLTPDEERRILELAAEQRAENEFVLTPRQIGQRLGLTSRTVYRVIRRAAAQYVHGQGRSEKR